jgi:hypothetical protein
MARLGTKQRPAIVRVQTEARAKEIVSVFNEHGWQFILGIEPDKPENISDLKRLLKTKRSGQQIVSGKAKKPVTQSKRNAPLRVVQTQKKQAKSSATNMTVAEEKCEYFLNTGSPKLYAAVLGVVSVFLLVKLWTTPSMWYAAFLIIPLFCFLSLLYALVLNQRVILHGDTVTILRRMHIPLTARVADSLYEIVMKHGGMLSLRFRFHNGRKVAQISPSAYQNGDQLLRQLETIIKQENIDVDIIEK